MTGRISKLAVAMLAAAGVLALAAGAASASSEVVYNDIPQEIQIIQGPEGSTGVAPDYVIPYGFEYYQSSQFGAQFGFAGTDRMNPKITVLLGSEACQSGSGTSCKTTVNSKFAATVTVKLNEVSPGNVVGPLIAEQTENFQIPYRPSANKKCTGPYAGMWLHQGTCLGVKAVKVKFSMPGVKLPETVIVSFSTSATGLSVADTEGAVATLQTIGTDPGKSGANPSEEGLYVNSQYSSLYCGNTTPVGTFALTGLCTGWYGNQPLVSVKASSLVSVKAS